MKAQSAVEFLTTYAWAFLIIALFISVIVILATIKNPQEYSPSSCYITPELFCTGSVFSTNYSSSTFAIMFKNNMGVPLSFPQNSFFVYSPSLNYSYAGTCNPSYLPKDGIETCIAKIPKTYTVGVQINPIFKIGYSICQSPTSCTQLYNTTGTASDIVTFSKSTFSSIALATSTGTGNILINGVPYQSNTVVVLINNLQYSIYAQPPQGYSFNSWIVTNAVVGSTSLQSTTLYTTKNGSLLASFH